MSPQTQRNRSREGAIKGTRSYLKHEDIWRAVSAQVSAFRHSFPLARMLIVDANAGDGVGVPRLQLELFGEGLSIPTAEQAVRIASRNRCSVLLCEKDRARRASLKERFPGTPIIDDNLGLRHSTLGFDYVLIISDPCGPAGHSVDMLREIALRQRCDFVIVVNEAALGRIHGTDHGGINDSTWAVHRQRYPRWMLEPAKWAAQLNRRHCSATGLHRQSSNFHSRILVVADYLAAGAARMPFRVML